MKRAEYKARNNLYSNQIMQNTVYLIAEKIFKTNGGRNEPMYIPHKPLKLNLQQHILDVLLLIVAGVVSGALSKNTCGSHIQDFVSGILMALSVAELFAGILFIVKYMTKR